MNSMIFNPLEEFEGKFRAIHTEKTTSLFEKFVAQSGVNIEENRETVRLYDELRENLTKLTKKLKWFKFLRVIMCITLVLIPLVIMKTTPKIRLLRSEIENAEERAAELFAEANAQMLPLNSLFGDRDALSLIEETLPLISFDTCFSVKQEEEMKTNYDFCDCNDNEESTLDVLAGQYNENPFLFENRIVHIMGTETYQGSLTISWTETYRDSNGNLRTRTRTETLYATVTKPKPFYHTQIVLNYCSQGGPGLSFSREGKHIEAKSDRELERFVKRGEKKLQKLDDKAVANNRDFTSMSNSTFEVLFGALNRTNEVQYRSIFTPLAQTNMVSLLRSHVGYGDDFDFIKQNRTNRIISEHSQGRSINLLPKDYMSHSFDIIKENFVGKNTEFFRAVYFDFAPLFAIPAYQERPVHSLKPIPDYSQLYSLKECEALANAVDRSFVVHPDTKTQAILKSEFVRSAGGVDETRITSYSYDIEPRIDYVLVRGGDGRYHSVPVPWDEYLPLTAESTFFVSTNEVAANKSVMAKRNGLSIFRD